MENEIEKIKTHFIIYIYMNKTLFVIQNGTIIGIPLFFNWNTMSIKLNKMPDFIEKYFKNTMPFFDIQTY